MRDYLVLYRLLSVVVAYPQREEYSEISRAMNDTDHVNRLCLPNVGNHIRVEVPEAILPAERFIMVMATAGRSPQRLKALVKFRPQALSGIRTILGNVENNLLQVALGFRGEKEQPLH